jgi:hypothetical protein
MRLTYGVVSEDMDTLTHGATHLIRNFNKKGTSGYIFRKYSGDRFGQVTYAIWTKQATIYRLLYFMWL